MYVCLPACLHLVVLLMDLLHTSSRLVYYPPPRPSGLRSKLVTGIQDHIGSLNWGYRVALRDANVKYINAFGRFVDPYTIECTDRRGQVRGRGACGVDGVWGRGEGM